MSDDQLNFDLTCPIPISQYPQVLLAHGGGGKLMHNLISKMFFSTFDNPLLQPQHDGAVFQVGDQRLAFTTDSYVVSPLFFPGGNIGSMAVHGTVNDLTMCGARPQFLSLGLIIEEGLPMETLWQITTAIQQAAREAGVQIVTGDTKVVDRGKGDGIFINTAGIGVLEHELTITPQSIQDGDAIIVSGDVGRHGIAIMATREGLEFETTIESDSAPLVKPVMQLLESGIEVRCMRDLTRGGLATALIEIAEASEKGIEIEEPAVPVRPDVRGACEILGLDPLYVVNEGRFVLFVPKDQAKQALEILHQYEACEQATRIGTVNTATPGQSWLKTVIGVKRVMDMPGGEQLPRIC